MYFYLYYLTLLFFIVICPLAILNKSGDSSDKNNYRPIALAAAASKLFEICILEFLETYLLTHEIQFGFKLYAFYRHEYFTVKTLIKSYTDQNTPVYTCLLDASKAYDRVNYAQDTVCNVN